MMRERRNTESIRRTCMWFLMVPLLAGLWACVGSETGESTSDRASNQDASRSRRSEDAGARAVYLDTVSPLPYQVFEVEPNADESKKVTYRLMSLLPGPQESMIKTVRLALDSLQRADTTLVAVRAVLYAFHQTSQRQGKLIPVIWGEWIPPDGWDEAARSGRNRIHRSYVYAVNPEWGRTADDEE
ncbi:MAG: hypothetical protein PVI01_10890 [Gemmatimonadales bacterium]|jgi:hypothetical protein